MERDCEAALVIRLREGDASAFDRIYDTFNRPLLSFLTRMARNRSVAEDLLEETWLRLISNAGDLHGDTRLGPWLFTVARNLYVSHCRSRAREHSGAADLFLLWPGAVAQSPFDATSLNEIQERLEAAIASLPPIYREVILLVGVEQLRPADAAKVCGVSPESLRQRLSRARGLIARFLADRNTPSRMVSHDAGR
ncbi:MAG TPA: RNA polymerase sigma factor [Bryobacteraceae bacterium]|jgi:RNA polymerase sigma-70 factor (ECF subfamily)|nr:RNA polymerase sigma factor [Bryobacteraceae bacterium]